MTRIWRRSTVSGACALVATCALTLAAPVSATDVFHACSNNTTKKVRGASILANATPVCKVTETARTWNATGPAGADGAPGPAGQDGAPGPRGPSDAFAVYQEVGDARGPVSVPTSWVTVASLGLPAGSFVATASLYFTNDSFDEALAYCVLQVGDRNAQATDTATGQQAVSQALTVASTLSAAGSATLQCKNNGTGGSLAVQTYNLNAIQVGSLTFQ